MEFSITYKPLFEVEILHSYFLNDGNSDFLSMNVVNQKRRLKLLDISEFINVIPSQETIKKMTGHHLVFKKSKSGFTVYSKMADGTTNAPFINLADDLSLKFILKLKDPFFANYTNLVLSGKNTFFFGNKKPSTEGASFKYIPKKNENTLISNAYQLSDIGSKAVLEDLEGQNKIGVFGMVTLKMIGDTSDLSILTTQGKIRIQPHIFKIHFDNRQTFWRYIKASDGAELFTTASPNPLTKYGFIEILHNGNKFPNPSANHLIPETNNFFSEIYI